MKGCDIGEQVGMITFINGMGKKIKPPLINIMGVPYTISVVRMIISKCLSAIEALAKKFF